MSDDAKPDNAGRPLSRTRAEEVDGIVADIVEDMITGAWVAGKSHREIAKREGVSFDRVKDWATEAGRCLRLLERFDREELRARNRARLDRVYAMAIQKQGIVRHRGGDDEVIDQPDLKAAVAAVAEQGKLLGLNAPEKHEVAVVARFEALAPREQATWLRAKAAELLAEAERIEQDEAMTVEVSG